MSTPQDPQDPRLEHTLRRWLGDEAPGAAPLDLFDRVVATSMAGTQRRRWVDSLGDWTHPSGLRALTAAMVLLLPTLGIGTLLSSAPVGPAAVPSPTPFACPGTTRAPIPGGMPEVAWVVGSIGVGRTGHTATHLGDCRVLMVGGGSPGVEATSDVELWDPARGSVARLAPTGNARVAHAATLLDDGRVLIVGGLERGPRGEVLGPVMTAEVWDPTTSRSEPAGSFAGPFAMPTATLLDDGRVLVLGGGRDRTSALLWDPMTAAFEPTGSLHDGRAGGQTATLLPDGTVLVIGGFRVSADDEGQPVVEALRSVEVYDPGTGSFHEAPPLPEGRYDHTTTLLPSGHIVVAGGTTAVAGAAGEQAPSAQVLLRDRASGVFHASGTLLAPRTGHDAALLDGGGVLLIGSDDFPAAGTAEAWDPRDGTTVPLGPPSVRFGGQAALLPDGTMLLSGGLQPPLSAGPEAPPSLALDLEVYDPTP